MYGLERWKSSVFGQESNMALLSFPFTIYQAADIIFSIDDGTSSRAVTPSML
jgi:hypothetical protein